MSEESAYPVMSAEAQEGSAVSNDGVPDLPGLFPSLSQDQEPFSATDLPLPVSDVGESAGPRIPPVSSEAPIATETASEDSDTNFGALMAKSQARLGPLSLALPYIMAKKCTAPHLSIRDIVGSCAIA